MFVDNTNFATCGFRVDISFLWGNSWTFLFDYLWDSVMTKLNFVQSLLTEIKLQYSMPGPKVPLAMCLASKHNPQYYGAKNWYRAISWFKLLVKKRVVIRGTPKRHGIFVMTFAMRAHNSLWNTPVRGQNNQLLQGVKKLKCWWWFFTRKSLRL